VSARAQAGEYVVFRPAAQVHQYEWVGVHLLGNQVAGGDGVLAQLELLGARAHRA
jgi:hypothetical protein